MAGTTQLSGVSFHYSWLIWKANMPKGPKFVLGWSFFFLFLFLVYYWKELVTQLILFLLHISNYFHVCRHGEQLANHFTYFSFLNATNSKEIFDFIKCVVLYYYGNCTKTISNLKPFFSFELLVKNIPKLPICADKNCISFVLFAKHLKYLHMYER